MNSPCKSTGPMSPTVQPPSSPDIYVQGGKLSVTSLPSLNLESSVASLRVDSTGTDTYVPHNILVTGGCGFIASNLINYLAVQYPDANIVNIDRLDYCSSTKNVQVPDETKYTFYKGDINNFDLLNIILKNHNIDTILHLAAQTHVDNSFINSLDFTRDNVLGTHYLLEAARLHLGLKRFVHFSTDEVYGEVDMLHDGCTEKALLNPTNPYAATKAAAEFLCRAYNFSYKLPIIIIRCNNVYGPRQYAEKVIPRFIDRLLSGQKCQIHGQGLSRRNYIYVDDVCRAIDVIMTKGIIMQTYNIGTVNEHSTINLAETLIKEIKGPDAVVEDWIEFVTDRNFNDFRYSIDTNNLKNLGWRDTVTFTDGLSRTIKWYTENHKQNTISSVRHT